MGAPAAVPTRPLTGAQRFALAACGLGWIPKAPGTWGSLGTVLVALPFLGSPLLAWTCVGLLVLAGSLAAWMVVSRLMSLNFVWFPLAAFAVTLAALVFTLLLGVLGTLSALRQKPAPVLRHL